MFISRHTLKWTKTCRSSGDFPHAHTAHFLLNRHINPRSPDGERLAHRLSNVSLMTLFQSTLPGWGATKDGTRHPCPPPISIHAPRMGSDCCVLRIIKMHNAFQSTLPGWGATVVFDGVFGLCEFQSTLPGWGATPNCITS